MRDAIEDAVIIVAIAAGVCGAAFVTGVAAGLFRLGMGLTG